MENIRIQDDLYMHVNGETLENLVIPDDKPTAGGFSQLAESVEKIMMDEFEAMTANESYPNDYLRRACKLYAIAKDTERKAQHGITPALKALAVLNEVNTMEDFARLYKTLTLGGIPTPIAIGVETDMKNTKRRLVYIQGNILEPLILSNIHFQQLCIRGYDGDGCLDIMSCIGDESSLLFVRFGNRSYHA